MSIDNNNLFFPPAKLNRPPIGRQWIERPRLLEALDESLGGKLTLISAPAGYGKTTLVLQWLNHISCHSAWLSLDKSDSTPDRFLYSLIATIRGIFSHFDSQTSRLLSAQTLPPPEYLVDVFIHHLAALNTPLVLAIDDFHLITSEDVHKMIKRVVQYMPKGLHLNCILFSGKCCDYSGEDADLFGRTIRRRLLVCRPNQRHAIQYP